MSKWLESMNNLGMVLMGIGSVHADQGDTRGVVVMGVGLALALIALALQVRVKP